MLSKSLVHIFLHQRNRTNSPSHWLPVTACHCLALSVVFTWTVRARPGRHCSPHAGGGAHEQTRARTLTHSALTSSPLSNSPKSRNSQHLKNIPSTMAVLRTLTLLCVAACASASPGFSGDIAVRQVNTTLPAALCNPCIQFTEQGLNILIVSLPFLPACVTRGRVVPGPHLACSSHTRNPWQLSTHCALSHAFAHSPLYCLPPNVFAHSILPLSL